MASPTSDSNDNSKDKEKDKDKDRLIAVRFHLPTGEKMAIGCSPRDTFGSIKDKIWIKKPLFPPGDKPHYTFRIVYGELFFNDNETFARFLELCPVFRESEGKQLVECVMLPRDVMKNVASQPTFYGLISKQGHMYQKGSPNNAVDITRSNITVSNVVSAVSGVLGLWKDRYFVQQEQSLFVWDSEEAFKEKKDAKECIPLGSCRADRIDLPEKEKKPFAFEISYSKTKDKSIQFACDSFEEMNNWINLINVILMRRTKLITVNVCEELESRNAFDQEGLFRVSGSKSEVDRIKNEYDDNLYPNLGLCRDDHALAGLLKMCIRELPEPLLTYKLYPEFIQSIKGNDDNSKITRTREVIQKMPPTNQGLLSYLIRFLSKVSEFSEVNKMSPKNLSIVFAPNILRPKDESVASVMTESKAALDLTELLISKPQAFWDYGADTTLINVAQTKSNTDGSEYNGNPNNLKKVGVNVGGVGSPGPGGLASPIRPSVFQRPPPPPVGAAPLVASPNATSPLASSPNSSSFNFSFSNNTDYNSPLITDSSASQSRLTVSSKMPAYKPFGTSAASVNNNYNNNNNANSTSFIRKESVAPPPVPVNALGPSISSSSLSSGLRANLNLPNKPLTPTSPISNSQAINNSSPPTVNPNISGSSGPSNNVNASSPPSTPTSSSVSSPVTLSNNSPSTAIPAPVTSSNSVASGSNSNSASPSTLLNVSSLSNSSINSSLVPLVTQFNSISTLYNNTLKSFEQLSSSSSLSNENTNNSPLSKTAELIRKDLDKLNLILAQINTTILKQINSKGTEVSKPSQPTNNPSTFTSKSSNSSSPVGSTPTSSNPGPTPTTPAPSSLKKLANTMANANATTNNTTAASSNNSSVTAAVGKLKNTASGSATENSTPITKSPGISPKAFNSNDSSNNNTSNNKITPKWAKSSAPRVSDPPPPPPPEEDSQPQSNPSAEDSKKSPESNPSPSVYVEALYDHAGDVGEGELILVEGDIILVMDDFGEAHGKGWWMGKKIKSQNKPLASDLQKEGFFPSNFTKIVQYTS